MSLIGASKKDVFFVTFQGESGNSMVFDTLNKSYIEKYTKKMNLNIENIEKRKRKLVVGKRLQKGITICPTVDL